MILEVARREARSTRDLSSISKTCSAAAVAAGPPNYSHSRLDQIRLVELRGFFVLFDEIALVDRDRAGLRRLGPPAGRLPGRLPNRLLERFRRTAARTPD